MLTLKRNMSARVSGSVFVVLLIYFFASWFMLAPPGAAGEAHAGQLEFDGVPVDITTAANEDLVIAPGSGGNSQIGTATGTNTHATTNNDLHITGVLEVDGVSYHDSAVYLGDTTSDTVTVTGYFGSSLIPFADSTYDLGSASLAWRYLYADIISGYNANLALNPATGYSLTGAVTKSASSGNEVAYDYAAIINKAAGNYTGIRLNLTQTAASGPATANFLLDLQLGGVSMFNVDSAGNVTAVGTITGSGAAINGTTSHTFTVNSNNDNALTTLRLGGSGGSNGQVTTVSGNLVIDSNGGTIDVNDGILDLSTQTVDVTLNDAVDSLNFDSDTLSIDAQNNLVGIGTAVPDSQLHVSEPTGIAEVAKFEGVNGASIRIDAQIGANTSTTRNYIADTLSAEAGYTPIDPGSGYFISVGGSRYLTLNTNGFLGLGDTSPVANLVVGSDAGAAVAGAGDAYIQNDLEVDGTLYAASASIAGTSSDTFTIDTDNTSATPTLTFGNGGNPFITTPAGNLNLQPASAVIVRDATAPVPAKATAAGSMFVENVFENTGIAYHYDDITLYDKKSFAVISSASGNPDYAHSIYISQSDNLMQFKEWDTFKFTNTSAEPDVDLITLTPTAGMALLNEDVVDNAVSDILKIQHSTTNAPQAGIGTGLAYYVEDAGNLQKHGSIDTVLTTVTQGSENADMVFSITEAGVLTELMRLNAASDRVDISGDLNVTGTISGAISSAGTTSDTWEVNTDGNSVTIDSSGQTSDHDYTFPNVSGKVLTTNMSDAIVAVTLNDAINALNFDADTLTIDAASNRVGINTGNPGAQLEVVGTLKVVTGSESTFYAAAVGPYLYIQPKDVAGTDYTRVGGWSSAAAATNLVLQPAGGNIGIGGTFDGNPTTIAPSYLLSLDGQSGRTVGMERHQAAGQAGNDLSVQAGGAYATGSNLNGGNLILKAGTATGTGASAIIFQTAKAAAAGAADNDPATKALIGGTSLALSPHGTAAGNTLELRFSELAAGGSNYVGFKAPDAIGDDLIWTLPSVDGSDGHVLKTDGLGTLSFGAVGGSTAITGTTNDTFEVNSDGNSVTVSSAGQTSDHVFTFPDATGTVLTNNMPADTAVTLGGGIDALNFDSNTLSIDADANRVGIGTASPQYSLDVVETARINNTGGAASLILTGSGDAFAYSYVNLLNEAGDKSWNVQHRKAAGFVNDFIIEEYDGAAYYQRFIMRPGGAVGIGTTDFDSTPALGHLMVKGTTNDGSTNIQVWRDSDEANVAYLDTNGNLTLSGVVSASASALTGTTADTFTVNSDGTAVASTLALGAAGTTGGSITTGAGNLTLDSAGGIIDINDGVLDLSTQTVDVTLNAAADALNFDSNTLSIDASADRVGIGKANPDHKLDVEGNVRITNSASHANLILSGAGDAFKYSAINLYNEAGDKLWSIHHRKSAVELNNFLIEEYDGVDYYQRVSVAPGGNMAIGTVDFDGTPAAGRLIVKGTTNDGSTNIFVGRDSDEANVAYLDTNGNLTLSGSISAGSSSLSGTTTDTFEINSDDNSITVSSAGQTSDHVFTFPNATGKVLTTDMSDATVAVTLSSASDALNFASDTLSIDASNGRVGFGTNAPLSRIHGVTTLSAASGNEIAYKLDYTTNKAAGDDTGLLVNLTDTASPGTSRLLDLQVGGASRFSVRNDGLVMASSNVQTSQSFTTNSTDSTLNLRGFGGGSTAGAIAKTFASIGGGSSGNNSTAGAQTWLSVTPVYNQVASTASNTDLLINRTQTSIGSGAQYLIDAQVGGTSMFNIANTGQGYFAGYIGIGDASPVASLVVGDDTAATVSGAGSAYIQNDLEVDGTFTAGSVSISGTTADTFEVNTDGFGTVLSTTNRSTDGTYTFPNVAGAAQILTTNLSDDEVAVTLYAAGVNGLSFDTDTLSIDAQNHWVGIGTASPDARLTVDGGGSSSGYVSTRATNDNYCGILFTDADGLQWGLYKNATADPILQFGRYTDGVWQAAPISFARNGDVIFGDRYVGIGDSDPVASLVVGSDAGAAVSGAGDAYIQNDLEVDGTLYAAATNFAGTTSDTFEINTDGNSVTVSSTGQTSDHIFTFPDVTSKVLTSNMSDATVAVTLYNAADALNFDTNTLSIDADANRIGIGTATPGAKLDIKGVDATSNNAALNILNSNDISILYVLNNRYIGIGTVTPEASLDIKGLTSSDALRIGDDGLPTTYYKIGRNSSTGLLDFQGMQTNYSGYNFKKHDGTSSVYVQPTGTVGVGTTDFDGTPAIGQLIVKGTTNDGSTNAQIWRDSDEANVAYLDTNGNLTLSGSISASGNSFSGTTADTFTVNSDGTAATSTLALGAAGTTGGQVTTGAGNLTIDSTGGTIDINDGVLDLSTQTVDVTLNAAADALNFDTNTLSIDADANRIGIGTPSPSSDLHVVTAATTGNGVYIDGSTITEGNALGIEIDATAMTTGYPFIITRDTVDMLHVTESGGVVSENIFTSDTDSTENLRLGEDQDASIGYDGSDLVINPRVAGSGDMVLSSGNIGIGTAAPDYLLTIAPPLNAEASLGMMSTSGAGAEIYFGYSGAYNAAIGYTQNFEGAIEFKTNGTNNASSKMILTSSGKVGIGTGVVTEPAAALDVQAAVTAASANAYGVRLQQTLTAAADNDALNSLCINTTYADGGFSGVKHNGIAFPDAQGTKINLGYDAAKAKWIGIDGSWRQGFANDTGFEFYISSTSTAWGDSKFHIDNDSADFYVDPVVGTSGTNRWLKMFGNILFEENDDYIGTYNTGTFTVGNLQNTSTATTVNFGRDGGIDIMNFNRGGTTYNFLTLSSAGTDDITLDPAGGDVSVDGNIATTSNGNITAGGSGAVQCGTGAFKSSDGTAGLTGTYNIDGSVAGTVATMEFKNGILVAVTTR